MALRRVNEALVRYEAYATRDDAAVQAAFYEHDTDGSGYLDIYEVQAMLQKMHTSVEASKVAELFDRYDDDGSGEIGYYEFRMLVLERWATGGLYMEWSTLDAIVQMYDVPVRVAIASTAAVEYICMEGEFSSFIYRYILREYCSQFDSLPSTSLSAKSSTSRASPSTTTR